jgi:ATPase family associated with various cellular activities (AAA)
MSTKQTMVVVQQAPTEPSTDWTKIDTSIKFDGKQIVLPADPSEMDYDDAIETIGRIRDQENQEFDVKELVQGAPWDTLVAVYRAMQEIYGVVLAQSQKTWFGEIKPDFITVHTGYRDEDRIQVPMGQMSLPGVEAPVQIVMRSEGTFILGTVRRRDRARLVEIANLARAMINTNSVYKGKAIRLNVDEDGSLELSSQPEFLNLTGVKESDIIHTKDTEAQIRTNLFAPLKHTDACRKNRIPLKRGILLEGKYGTGKSLTARVTAKIATDNGWTFIMLNRAQGLRAAIEFARIYQPCVIFAEDIDRAADREDEDVNDLVNLLDGMISKTMEMMVVLTTNFIDKIDRSLLRPGRFDAVISIDTPDADTAQRIIRSYARELLDVDEELGEVGEATAGMIPASIREVVERAKLSMLTEGRLSLSAEDLRVSAIGMKRHMALLDPKPADESIEAKFIAGFKHIFTQALEAGLDIDGMAQEETVQNIRGTLNRAHLDLATRVQSAKDVATAAATSAQKGLEYNKIIRDRQEKQGEILEEIKDQTS